MASGSQSSYITGEVSELSSLHPTRNLQLSRYTVIKTTEIAHQTMSRSAYAGPKLPKTLLDQVHDGRVQKNRGDRSRKERRQAERAEKKQARSGGRLAREEHTEEKLNDRSRRQLGSKERSNGPEGNVKPVKSILKSNSKSQTKAPQSDEEDDDVLDLEDPFADEDDFEDDGSKDLDGSEASEDGLAQHTVSRSARVRLEEDDAEIARLEKKLGIKKSSKKVNDDELDWLINGSDSEQEGAANGKRGRDTEDDEWLRSKRRKARSTGTDAQVELGETDESEGDLDADMFDGQGESEDDIAGDSDFEGFSEDEDPENPVPAQKPQRENPYVAPMPKDTTVTKYIPPSLRKPSTADEEVLKQIQRQLQGLLNRLSEANILSILQSIEKVYAENARQHVTSTLIDLLASRTADVSTLSDTFLILHAAFATAVYRVIGPDFIAQFVEELVKRFDESHLSRDGSESKQSLNLLAFLSNLYVFQAIGCEIIFDYVRLLLADFSESSTELLLRVIRTCGSQLRQDDPSALKDIVLLLQRSIAKVGGEGKVSVRTKFMVETIMDLKNNRMKNGIGASAMAAQHVQTMKKTLGSLNVTGKHARNTEPLRISLKDLRDSEKKGKWWLVGASWRDPAKMADQASSKLEDPKPQEVTVADDHASDEEQTADLAALARSQGMNTDVRRAIFFALLDSVSVEHAHERILKLNLKNKQMLEIPRVVLRCAAAEKEYNHFYTLVARRFCSEHRLRKAWEFSLLDVFRRMGEDGDHDDDDMGAMEEDGSTEKLSVREAYNLAKLYASLVAEGLLRVSILKTLDFSSPTGLKPTTKVFVHVLLSSIILTLKSKSKAEAQNNDDDARAVAFQTAISATFAYAQALPDLALGLRYHTSRAFSKDDVAAVTRTKKEQKVVLQGIEIALETLEREPASESHPVKVQNGHDSDSDNID